MRLVVDREEAAGGAVFGRHVGDGGAVGERERVEARAVELDELVHDAQLAQHLRHGEHEVGRGAALLELAGQLEADDRGQQHRERLAEHHGLGLDAADAPAEHRQRVDHGGVGIRTHQRVGIGHRHGLAVLLLLPRPHGLAEVFEVDLVADAGAGRHHAEVRERVLAPAQEPVALAVALVFELDVVAEGLGGAELVDDDRVVDDEVDGDQRVDLLDLAAELAHGVAHGGEVDHRRHAGEVLHQHARRAERDLTAVGPLGVQPGHHAEDVVLGDAPPVLVPQQVLEQHLHGVGQP